MIAYFVKIQATKEHEYEIDEIDKISFWRVVLLLLLLLLLHTAVMYYWF